MATEYVLTKNDYDHIDFLISNQDAFDQFVYMPWRQATEEIAARSHDTLLENYLYSIWKHGLPHYLEIEDANNIVLCRHIASPSFEFNRFVQIVDAMTGLNFKPLILEFWGDRYVNVNHAKDALANLCFYQSHGALVGHSLEYRSVIARGDSNGRPFYSIQTHWGENLIDFHHQMLFYKFPHLRHCLLDVTEDLHSFDTSARGYYPGYLSIFLRKNIMLENFLLKSEEQPFIKKILLPTLIKIRQETGLTPLIVKLGPSGDESNPFWYSYDPSFLRFVDKRFSFPSHNLLQSR